MAEFVGRIAVPTPLLFSGLTFPLISNYPVVITRPYELCTHRFGGGATLSSQQFAVGFAARRFQVAAQAVPYSQRAALLAFYNAVQGSYQSFLYSVPNADGSTTPYPVTFDTPPLSITDLATMCRTGFTLVEDVTTAQEGPYSLSGSPLLRFPNDALSAALLDQVQRIIPLVHIRVRNSAVPDIYLSDRRVVVSGQTYLPRLLNMGEPGTDVVMSQSISGAADNVQFTFGNADRVMSRLASDCGLQFAVVDLSLYHVQTGILLQLWKGVLLSWTGDGSAQFRISCSDGLYPVTQNYPRRTITRQCWKTFNDGVNCPWATTPGATGNPSACDYFFNSPNGCLSHGMSPFFGGHFSIPQSVTIHDEGTAHLSIDWSPWMLLSPAFGGLQIARNTVVATSIVADNIWGSALAEIYCNDDGDPRKAFWTNATVIATRDESTFQDMLGLIGVGPLGAYEGMSVQTNSDGFKFLVTPLADGFPPQGFKIDSNLNIKGYHPELGWRAVVGTDPAVPATDPFSLGQGTPQRWDLPDPTFSNILTHQPNDILPFAAGTAFVEMRYSKDPAKGITPTTPGSHSMTVPIALGLTGYRFDSDGNRTAEAGLTNPFWIAVNTYLRALGLDKADAATQLATFDLTSLSNFDAVSGCAQIADLQVTPIIGDQSTVETQFRFQGLIATFKPFRDWLTAIMNCCLGYYVFEYGRLKLGVRENASATTGFTVGNMLYQSLSLTPVPLGGEFEYLKISFANRDLQYQQDMAEYQDKDHAAYYNRAGAPLTTPMNSPGLAGLSQGLRIAATRTREEIGGVLRPDHAANPYVEWDNNLLATWRTTILALDTEVGQVVSVTHPDLATYPGYPGSIASPAVPASPPNTWKFRIQKWTLHKDWSITIQGRSCVDSMYDLEFGPKPADQVPPTQPPLLFAIPHGPVWAPHQIQADAADALYPSEWSFDTDEEYITLADGSASAVVNVTGVLPVNTFAPGMGTPSIASVSQFTTGGFIPGATTYRLCVVAYTSAGLPSPPSQIIPVQVPPGSVLNSIVLTVVWPKVAGLVAYTVYASTQDDLICSQTANVLAASGDGTVYSPTTITLVRLPERSTYSLPSPFVAKLRLKAKLVINGGVAGVSVDSVAVNTLVCSGLIDLGGSPIDWTGRTVSIYGRTPGSTPWASFRVTAFNTTTGALTLDRDPTGIVLAGDALVVRIKPTISTLGSYTTLTDPAFENVTNAFGGLSNPLAGEMIRVIAGTGRGSLPATITANTTTSITWDTPIQMNADTVVIVEEPTWRYQADLSVISNPNPAAAVTLALPVDNFANQSILIAGFTVDVDGSESPDGDQPIREDFIFGAQGTRTITANSTMLPTDGLVTCIATAGNIVYTCLPQASVRNQVVIVQKVPGDANTVTIRVAVGSGDTFLDGTGTIDLTDAGQTVSVLKFNG